MAKIPQVTRTIQTTKATVLCADITAQKTFTKEFTLSGTFKDNRSMFKALEKIGNTDTTKVVHIIEAEVNETLYGMSEQTFINNAEILPPRKVKEAE